MKLVRRALVSMRVLKKVFLVILLCVEPIRYWRDLRHNLFSTGAEMLFLNLFCNLLCYSLLLRGMRKNSRSVF
jgi:hypothetical protein